MSGLCCSGSEEGEEVSSEVVWSDGVWSEGVWKRTLLAGGGERRADWRRAAEAGTPPTPLLRACRGCN